MSRFDTLELVRDFLANQYSNHIKIEAQIREFTAKQEFDKVNRITSDANYMNNMRLRFSIDQLSKTMPFNYNKLRYALFGAVEADIRAGRQVESFQDLGIVIHYDYGLTKPMYSYDPNVLSIAQRSALSRPINVTVESNPIPTYPTPTGVNPAPAECTKEHCPENREKEHTFVENLKKFMDNNLIGKGFPPFEGKDYSQIMNLLMDNAAQTVRQYVSVNEQST